MQNAKLYFIATETPVGNMVQVSGLVTLSEAENMASRLRKRLADMKSSVPVYVMRKGAL